ncbi:MAG: serine/threonine-protein kinase [Archangium sp.]
MSGGPHNLDETVPSGQKLDDTFVSGEKKDPTLTTSGIQKGEALDRYVILDRLGAGGMGEVYAAWDPVLDRKVAVKVLRPDIEGSAIGEELKHRLLGEAQSLAKLAHPNVVTVHDVGLAGDRVYLAMEFIEGRTLKDWLQQVPRPTWQRILEVFLAAGEGVVAAHAQGITHRDFKPDNVVVGSDGRVRVMDFGLAHGQAAKKKDEKSRRTITQPGAMLGTPAYMSPEALHGQPTDFRSDEFSFCVSLYEALYGFRPFEGATPGAIASEIIQNRVRSLPSGTKVPRRIHQLILKGLRNDPAERFQTMRALLVQLGRTRIQREQRIAGVAVAVLAVVAVSLIGLATWRERNRCLQVADRLHGVWDENVKRASSEAFAATHKPWAAAAWRDVESRVDAYAQQWVSQRQAVCEAGPAGDDERYGQELLCLSRRLSDLEATTQLFLRADADVVERAVTMASTLPSLAGCRNVAPSSKPSPESEPLRGQLSAARARIDSGKYADALKQSVELAEKAEADGNREAFAEARLWGAIARMRLGDAKAAEAWVEESILAASESRSDELEARGWVERVGFAALSGPSADAERWVRFAQASIARVAPAPELQASLFNNQGVLAHLRGQFAAAVDAHKNALELRTQLFGDTHPLVARSHSNLGAAYRALGRLDEARIEYEQALSIEEKTLDPSHPQVADTLNNLGNVLNAQGSPTGARRALERSLRIKEAAFGPDSTPVAVTLSNLGSLLTDLADYAEAERALTRAVEIKEKQSGPDSLTLAVSLTNLAQARRGAKKWAESIELDDRALKIRQLRQGDSHVDAAYNLTGIGEARLMQGDRPGAQKALERAFQLRAEKTSLRATTAYWLSRALPSKDGRAKSLLIEAVQGLSPSDPLLPLAKSALEDSH